MKVLKRVLIVNRGEIAERISRTCLKLGLSPIIVYSDADRETLAVQNAINDGRESYRLGTAKLSDSYLNIEKILKLAKDIEADAIHPGYGLLSENSDFAKQVERAGLIWIGPSPESMDALSSKSQAKDVAKRTKVPILPSFYAKDNQDIHSFIKEAERIGFPVLLKATAGGGGRGIRLVEKADDLKSQFELASSEALNSFGSGELLLEKYLPEAHHIEIQIFGDKKGNILHLGERDCSTQRRHQKLIEESPSPALDSATRDNMTSDAVRLAQACGYYNAGTVEFLLSPEGEYYFLEVNTRLQVEHPVTEMVTGLDLVEWQLRVAQGDALPLKQSQVKFKGHSIQARIYAEDPYENYRPQMGQIEGFHFPVSPNSSESKSDSNSTAIRVDHFLTSRTVVSSFYDSMLAKLIVAADDRNQCIEKLNAALDQTLIAGLKTNRLFLKQILNSDFFVQGKTFTRTLDHTQFKEPAIENVEVAAALCAAALRAQNQIQNSSAKNAVGGWSNNPLHKSVVLIQARVEDSGRSPSGTHQPKVDSPSSGQSNIPQSNTGHFNTEQSKAEPSRTEVMSFSLTEESAEIKTSGTTQKNRLEFLAVTRSNSKITIENPKATRLRDVTCFEGKIENRTLQSFLFTYNEKIEFLWEGQQYFFVNPLKMRQSSISGANANAVLAPLEGTVIRVLVNDRQQVQSGDLLIVIEAMKMQFELRSPREATIESVAVQPGTQVKNRQVLLNFVSEATPT